MRITSPTEPTELKYNVVQSWLYVLEISGILLIWEMNM